VCGGDQVNEVGWLPGIAAGEPGDAAEAAAQGSGWIESAFAAAATLRPASA